MVPMKYKGLGLDRYDADEYNKGAADAARSLIGETRCGYFYGGPGTGKSMMAAIFANEKIKSGVDTDFASASDIIAEIRSAADSTARKSIISHFSEVPALVIDDFGAQKTKADDGEELLGILKTRRENSLQTIIASEYLPDKMAERFAPPAGDEISSEIGNGYEVIRLR